MSTNFYKKCQKIYFFSSDLKMSASPAASLLEWSYSLSINESSNLTGPSIPLNSSNNRSYCERREPLALSGVEGEAISIVRKSEIATAFFKGLAITIKVPITF